MTLVAQGQKSYSRNSIWNKAHHLSNSSLHKNHEKVLPSIKNYTYFLTLPSHRAGICDFLLFFFHFLTAFSSPSGCQSVLCRLSRGIQSAHKRVRDSHFPYQKKRKKKRNPKFCRPLEAAKAEWRDPPAWGRGSGSRPAPSLPINHGTSSPKLAGLNETARAGVQAMWPQSYRSLPECGPFVLWAII